MDDYLNLKDISKILGLRKDTITYRFNKIGVYPIYIKGIRFYKSSDINLIKKKLRNKFNIGNVKERFSIIEYFLSNRNNSSSDISKVCPLSTAQIDKILTSFIKDDFCITVPSKLNSIDHEY